MNEEALAHKGTVAPNKQTKKQQIICIFAKYV